MRRSTTVLLLIITLIVSQATQAEILFDPLYNDSSRRSNFKKPKVRDRYLNPSIRAEINSVTIEIGETVLLPVFSEVSDRIPFPISWAIENDREAHFTAILDEARPVSRNRESWMLVGPGFITETNLTGPSVKTSVSEFTGCERRFYNSTKLRFEEGILMNSSFRNYAPSAYICIHGITQGKGEIIIGENFPEGEFGSNPSGNYVLLNRKAFVNPLARTSISVEVVPKTELPELRRELAFADTKTSGTCNIDNFCSLHVIPLNRGGESIGCGDNIEVEWLTPTGRYDEDRSKKCTIKLKPKFIPPKGSKYYQSNYGVRAIVSQVIKREMNNPIIIGRKVRVENVRQAQSHFLIHPTNSSKTIDVMWGRLSCPKFVTPGIPFRCDSQFSSDDGNNPTNTNTLALSNWRVPSYISNPVVSSSDKFSYCMTVDENTPDDEVFEVSARNQENGIFVWSRKITVSSKLTEFIGTPKDC